MAWKLSTITKEEYDRNHKNRVEGLGNSGDSWPSLVTEGQKLKSNFLALQAMHHLRFKELTSFFIQ